MSTTQIIASKTTRAAVVVAFVIALATVAWLRSGPAESAAPAAVPNNERIGTLTFTGFSPLTVSIRSFSFNASAEPCGSGGGGGCAGRPNIGEPAVGLDTDATTPLQFRTLVTGSHIPKLTIVLFKPFTSQRAQEFVFDDAQLTQLSLGASTPNKETRENLAWAFKQVTHRVYVPGTNTVLSSSCYNLVQNQTC